jgi:hypothetical protein
MLLTQNSKRIIIIYWNNRLLLIYVYQQSSEIEQEYEKQQNKTDLHSSLSCCPLEQIVQICSVDISVFVVNMVPFFVVEDMLLYNMVTIIIWDRSCCDSAPQPRPRHLNVDVTKSQTVRHTHPVGLLCTRDQLVTEAVTCTTHNKHKRHSCRQRDSNPLSQQSNGRRTTL